MTRIVSTLLVLSSAAVVPGCGGPDVPDTVKVRGTIRYNGQPLTSGTVTFSPSSPEKGRAAQAEIRPDGAFAPSTFAPGDGLVAGTYNISVVSFEKGTELEKDKGTGIGGKSAIPAKYGDPKTSGLTETIGPGDAGKVIAIEVKD